MILRVTKRLLEEIDTEKVFLYAQLPKSYEAAYLEAQRFAKMYLGEKLELQKPGTQHVTLAYIGPMPAKDVRELTGMCKAACRRHKPVKMQPQGMSFFTPSESSDWKWPIMLDYQENPELQHFRASLMPSVNRWQPNQKFPVYVPHTTLGYLDRELTETEKRDLKDNGHGLPAWTLDEMIIGGSNYKVLERIRLG